MSLGNPVLHLRGRVRRFEIETIPELPARDAAYDDDGRQTSAAREGRPGYDLAVATIDSGIDGHSTEAGPATVVWKIDGQGDVPHRGVALEPGDVFDGLVRPFLAWTRVRGRNMQVLRFGLVSTTVAATGSRPLAVASGS